MGDVSAPAGLGVAAPPGSVTLKSGSLDVLILPRHGAFQTETTAIQGRFLDGRVG
jgi:hypothetical protein